MRSPLMKNAPALLLAVLVLVPGCDDGADGDADVDSDVDSDVDGDVDSDADSDSEPACGTTDGPCCAVEPACQGDLVCASSTTVAPTCFAPCVPQHCDYGTVAGTCIQAGTLGGVCAAAEPRPVACDEDECETEYGVSENTRCVQDELASTTYCFESCPLYPNGCDDETHLCVALSDDGGVCQPR